MMRKRIAAVLAIASIGGLGLVGGAPASQGPDAPASSAIASKTCGYGTPASTPGGVKCLGPGEYCSHKPGYAKAYRKAGFRCNRGGRLEER